MPIGDRHYEQATGECLGGNLRLAHTAGNPRVFQTRRKTRRQARINLASPLRKFLTLM